MNGSVNSTSSGLRIALKEAQLSSTTAISVPNPAHRMPEIELGWVARSTPIARISQRTSI